jgi:hypothetical protein
MNLLVILSVLLIALFILIPLLERSTFKVNKEVTAKISRWIIPALILIAVVQLLFMLF